MNAWPGNAPQQGRETPVGETLPPAATADDRVRQAARHDGAPETLRRLAQDPDIIVRAALAINAACSPEIDAILVADADDRVRALLGARIARLLPNLGTDVQDVAAEHVRTMLAILANDQEARVRAAIADAIKKMDIAPRDLVIALAHDTAAEVSAPILRLSPVLTDGDLLQLLVTPPFPASARSIADRLRLSAAVADAIVAHADAPAIRTLLANRSACIQEATLDALVGRAPNHVEWHAPLVRRPNLSAKAVRALSEFIATDLLRVLASRTDLDPAKLDIVRKRLAENAESEDEAVSLAEAQRLFAGNALTEALMLETLQSGDAPRLKAFLAVASGVTLQAVQRVIDLRSAKALVSLVWRGGFSMRVGARVQIMLAQFAPDHALQPDANGGFPLTIEEMDWQIELMHADKGALKSPGPTWSSAAAG